MGRKANPDCPCRHESETTCPCQTVWPDDVDLDVDIQDIEGLLYIKEEVIRMKYH